MQLWSRSSRSKQQSNTRSHRVCERLEGGVVASIKDLYLEDWHSYPIGNLNQPQFFFLFLPQVVGTSNETSSSL